jgi:hypothetical protein
MSEQPSIIKYGLLSKETHLDGNDDDNDIKPPFIGKTKFLTKNSSTLETT